MLSGDIGSGKSTILLAVEFALFGIRRGELSGEALLRHGESEGSVTLSFVCGAPITVHRSLKRTSSGVRQDDGYLEVAGSREELTAQELKARILDLLGYPEQLVSKAKSLVFRYTVYTPQEHMKQIIMESDQSRLDTLRAVFGVERYKTIVENAKNLGKQLRDDMRFLDGKLSDEDAAKERSEVLSKEANNLDDQLEAAQVAVEKSENSLKKIVADGERLEEAHKQHELRKERKAERERKHKKLKLELQSQQQLLEQLDKRLSQELAPVEDPSQQLEKVDSMRERYSDKHARVQAAKRQAKSRIAELREGLVADIDECPTCKQTVPAQHKERVAEHIAHETKKQEEKITDLDEKLEKLESGLARIRTKREALKALSEKFTQFRLAKQRRLQDAERKVEVAGRISSLKEELEKLTVQEDEKGAFDEKAYKQYVERRKQAEQALQNARLEQVRLKTRKEELGKQLVENKERLAKLKELRKERKQLLSREQWLSELFVPLCHDIEVSVLASIHQEFSRLFTEWLAVLVDDESLFADINSSFAPVVTQDGYDVEIQNLSGGEKTALALAYRLALNAVLARLLRTIKTTELLILDEPTDGFSADQLDRVRDVLVQLKCRQVILVSHEQRMEALVDQVVRIEKRQHLSVIT